MSAHTTIPSVKNAKCKCIPTPKVLRVKRGSQVGRVCRFVPTIVREGQVIASPSKPCSPSFAV